MTQKEFRMITLTFTKGEVNAILQSLIGSRDYLNDADLENILCIERGELKNLIERISENMDRSSQQARGHFRQTQQGRDS